MKNIVVISTIVAAFLFVGCSKNLEKQEKEIEKSELKFTNEQFYDSDGNFLEERAKDALMEMMEYHNYPVFEGLREQIWVSDYNAGNYLEVGLASVTFVNNEEDQYMLMDIFLLPGQMLAEHWHVAAEGNPAKMEGWLLRHGKSYVVGISENNRNDYPEVVVPKTHWDGKVNTNHIVAVEGGSFVALAKVESAHWQMAGPEGAVITEVANVHTGAGVYRSDPKMN